MKKKKIGLSDKIKEKSLATAAVAPYLRDFFIINVMHHDWN
jgi:hypothetical protein